MKYSFLEAKITERGIKKAAISAAISVTRNLLIISWRARVLLHGRRFRQSKNGSFLDMNKDDLFQQ